MALLKKNWAFPHYHIVLCFMGILTLQRHKVIYKNGCQKAGNLSSFVCLYVRMLLKFATFVKYKQKSV